MSSRTAPITNFLLQALQDNDRNKLLAESTISGFSLGDTIVEAGGKTKSIFFPLSGVVSLLVRVDGHHPLEVRSVGNEGMLDPSVALGTDKSPLKSIVQRSGTMLSIPVEPFSRLLESIPTLQSLLLCYVDVLMQQSALATACLHFHSIQSRLSRCLLTAQDRSQQGELYLTHSFLAQTLGVRRSGVSLAAKALQKAQLISYVRGTIVIQNRKGLERESCGCYRAMNKSYTLTMKSFS